MDVWLLLEKTNKQTFFFPTSITFVGRILLYLQNIFSRTDKSCYRFCKDTWDVTSIEHNKRMLSEEQKTINIDFGICCYCGSLLKVIMENVIFWIQNHKLFEHEDLNEKADYDTIFRFYSAVTRVVSDEKVTKYIQCRQWVSIEQSKMAETWEKKANTDKFWYFSCSWCLFVTVCYLTVPKTVSHLT